MTTLEDLPALGYLVVIDAGMDVLIDEPLDLPTFMRHLKIVGQYWARSFALGPQWGGGEVPFNTVLSMDRSAAGL